MSTIPDWAKPTRFDLGEYYCGPYRGKDRITVEARGEVTWVVTNGFGVLNADSQWEMEPLPSNRSDEFIARTRLPLDEALQRGRDIVTGATKIKWDDA